MKPTRSRSSSIEERKESSVLFSLNELQSIEEQRQRDEEQSRKERVLAEARARRDEEEAARRRQEEHEERLRSIALEEARAHLQHEERLRAAEQAARIEAEHRLRLQTELAQVHRSRRELELKSALTLGPARKGTLVAVVLGAVVLVAGILGLLVWRTNEASRAALEARRLADEAMAARATQQGALSSAQDRSRKAEQALAQAEARLRQQSTPAAPAGASPAAAPAAAPTRPRKPVRARAPREERSLEQLGGSTSTRSAGRKGPVIINLDKGPLGE